MTENITQVPGTSHSITYRFLAWIKRVDKAWLIFLLLLGCIAAVAPQELIPSLSFTLKNLLHTGVFIIFAVLLIAWLRATGAEVIVGKAFQGSELKMIFFAAIVGGLAPFCSCEVIPFIAALLAMGTPLSAVMAFWLSSPIIDPPMFVITASALGFDFAIAKTASAVMFGLFGGLTMMYLGKQSFFSDPLRASAPGGCDTGCGSSNPFEGEVVWRFWQDASRLRVFVSTAIENALFLLKWLALAYLIEGLMIKFVPSEWISGALGGDGLQPIALGALLGGPAYLNGYAAVPLVKGLLEQGMSQGAAMSFVLAGSVTCIPAAIAVWALVKPRVFAAYVFLGLTGAFFAGIAWSMVS